MRPLGGGLQNPGWDDAGAMELIPDGCTDEVAAAELLQMWFPDYGRSALEQLLEASGHDLWGAVEELLLMEGEEPYRRRQHGGAGEGTGREEAAAFEGSRQQRERTLAFTEAEFPTLGGAPASASVGRQQVKGKSAKDALLCPSSGPSAAHSHHHAPDDDCWEDGQQSEERPQFWLARGGQGQGHTAGASGAAMLPGGIPAVATGAALTRLYEAAREEAREHAYQRHVCFRQASRYSACP